MLGEFGAIRVQMIIRRLIHLSILAVGLSGCVNQVRDTDSLYAQVRALIDQATQSKTEAKAFRELQTLGTNAVPFLVGHLNDMRPLPISEIELSNHADDAFEGLAHYKPTVVHDALAAILNQLTGQSFVFVYNGATTADRKSNTILWQEWCIKTYPSKSSACKGDY